ncbi:hypothetical protein A6770_22000 [Nostoc minutum NIES-26]|uniref:NAD(+)--protein-arginine ADP-ribosyltransferase Tre1-like N-terminal domain-containing protein n=1 Tax=Nostoc minutum NIES-26 TaxID=1844469 RepID=A0A367QYW3_9NOSO|nr:hypothetical protein A6770_22000 [Nostoc minutum NIES-26]
MDQEKVERENTLSKSVQDKSDTSKPVYSLLPDPSQQLTLEEHRQKHEKVTPDWRNNNVLKSIKARSSSASIQSQSQLQTADNKEPKVQQKELQSNTSIVGIQAKDNSYQVASIWDDAVHQGQRFLNQVQKLGEGFWRTVQGGPQKVSDYTKAIHLSLQYIPQAIAQRVDAILKDALAGLAISLITAIGVVSLTTAIGAAIGSLGGGVGAVPGAAAGLRVGIFLLEKMGLIFLLSWIANGLKDVGVAFGRFLATVWNANGDDSAIDKGARQFADGMAQFIVLVLEGIVAYAIAHGQAKAMEMLNKSWFGQQLGSARLGQWLNQRLKARGEAITPDGQRMRIQGETPKRQQPMRMQGEKGNGHNSGNTRFLNVEEARGFIAQKIASGEKITLDLFGGETSQVPGAINFDIVAKEGIRGKVADLVNIFPKNSVHEIIANGPQAEFLGEVARILKPGGRIYINANYSNRYRFGTNRGKKPPDSETLKELGLRLVQDDGSLDPRFADLEFRRTDGGEIRKDTVKTVIFEKLE